MKEIIKLSWDLSVSDALTYNKRNTLGEDWTDLCQEFAEKQGYLWGEDMKSDWSNREYFRQKIRKIVRHNVIEDEIPAENKSIAEGLADIFLDPLTIITPGVILKMLNLDERYFEIDKKIVVNAWGPITTEEFARRMRNGQVKVPVKVKGYVLDEDKLAESISKVKPTKFKPIPEGDTEGALALPLFDLHFGFMEVGCYDQTKSRIISKIRSKKWNTIYIPVGQDLLHNNDLRGNTANGTPIEQFDMNMAIDAALDFYIPIVEEAVKNSANVDLFYSVGNHDESLALAVIRVLAALYPQAKADFSTDEYKLRNFGNNALGFTHSDKLPKNTAAARLHDLYMALFPHNFTMLHNREVFTGHFHKEGVKDENGTTVWSLGTRKGDDLWHIGKGFVGSKKRFTIFEFDEIELVTTHKV